MLMVDEYSPTRFPEKTRETSLGVSISLFNNFPNIFDEWVIKKNHLVFV